MTGLIASVVEAFGELRVHKGRIMLSLFGVAVSVFTLTGVLGAGGMLSSALEQSIETFGGRETVLSVTQISGGEDATPADRDETVLQETDRLGIEQRSRYLMLSGRFQTSAGVQTSSMYAVDPAYADMYRLRPEQGRWFADSDAHRLAPAVVISHDLWEQAGRPAVGTGTITLYDGDSVESAQALVVGVLPASYTAATGEENVMFTPASSADELPGVDDAALTSREYRLWVPPEQADAVTERLQDTLADTPVGSFDTYSMGYSMEDTGFGMLRNAVVAVAVAVLLLGALGLVNISLVTVRYRVREIGIRRSYGATGGRIFLGVLMESVVATAVAGVVGVAGAVALVRAPFTQDAFRSMGLVDVPAFPLSAVLIGLGAAIAVGILAGALPALIATRIAVIDAIRT